MIERGYDVKWISDYDCDMIDEELLKLANKEKRILITNDKDFGELIFLQKRLTAGIILMRVRGQRVKDKVKLIKKLVHDYPSKLFNHFTVITKGKIRFILMED